MSAPVLRAHKLHIGYASRQGAARTVAAGLGLTVQAGELVCLLGPNGAGKSTLLRTLTGMQPPLAGQVHLDGSDITTLTPRDLARRLSVVLTERVEVGLLSAYALVALGRHPYTDWLGRLTPHDETVIQRAIEAVDAVALAPRLFAELSDGERQRVLLARALAQEPRLLVLDEPTAFLDLPRRVALLRLLGQLAHTNHLAILISTHDLDLALRSADVLWLLDAAGTLHVGAPEDLVLNGAFAATFAREGVLFDMQTGTFQLAPQAAAPVTFHGTGLAAQWTTHALVRAGFRLAAQSPISIELVADESGPQWRVSGHGPPRTLASLYELIALLRRPPEP